MGGGTGWQWCCDGMARDSANRPPLVTSGSSKETASDKNFTRWWAFVDGVRHLDPKFHSKFGGRMLSYWAQGVDPWSVIARSQHVVCVGPDERKAFLQTRKAMGHFCNDQFVLSVLSSAPHATPPHHHHHQSTSIASLFTPIWSKWRHGL